MPITPWGPAPYAQKETDHRLNVQVSSKDVLLLKSICPHTGFISFIVQLAISRAANFARDRGLKYSDDPVLIDALRNGLCDYANSQTNRPSDPRNERGAGKKSNPNAKNRPDKPAAVQSASQVGQPDREASDIERQVAGE